MTDPGRPGDQDDEPRFGGEQPRWGLRPGDLNDLPVRWDDVSAYRPRLSTDDVVEDPIAEVRSVPAGPTPAPLEPGMKSPITAALEAEARFAELVARTLSAEERRRERRDEGTTRAKAVGRGAGKDRKKKRPKRERPNEDGPKRKGAKGKDGKRKRGKTEGVAEVGRTPPHGSDRSDQSDGSEVEPQVTPATPRVRTGTVAVPVSPGWPDLPPASPGRAVPISPGWPDASAEPALAPVRSAAARSETGLEPSRPAGREAGRKPAWEPDKQGTPPAASPAIPMVAATPWVRQRPEPGTATGVTPPGLAAAVATDDGLGIGELDGDEDRRPQPGLQLEPEPSTATAPDPNRIGIVFLPGSSRDAAAAAPPAGSVSLIRLITAWSTTTSGVRPDNDPTERASLTVSGGGWPLVVARVPALGDHPAQSWLMTEVRWTRRPAPPPLAAFVRWLVPGEVMRIWLGIVGGLGNGAGPVLRLADAVLLPLVLFPTAAFALVALALLRLLRVVPSSPVRAFADRCIALLPFAGRYGELRALVGDRIGAADVRAQVAGAIRDVRAQDCGTIVVVGHGTGAVAGYMTLADEAYADLEVDLFVTHGQSLGVAWGLGHADEYDVPDRHPDRLYRGDRLRGNLARLPFRSSLRWHDFRASHDPAPAGGLAAGPRVALPEIASGSSALVLNRMSLAEDHDAYWANDEEFVLPVARLIDTAPRRTTRRSRFLPEGRATNRVARRRHRVRLLQLARLVLATSAVAAIAIALVDPLMPGSRSGVEASGQAAWDGAVAAVDALRPTLAAADISFSLGGISRSAAAGLGAVLITVAYSLAWRLTTRLWTRWDARERRIALQPIPPWRASASLAVQLGLAAAASAWLVTIPATGDWTFGLPSAAAGLLAVGLAVMTGRGTIRRPPPEELAFEGVDP